MFCWSGFLKTSLLPEGSVTQREYLCQECAVGKWLTAALGFRQLRAQMPVLIGAWSREGPRLSRWLFYMGRGPPEDLAVKTSAMCICFLPFIPEKDSIPAYYLLSSLFLNFPSTFSLTLSLSYSPFPSVSKNSEVIVNSEGIAFIIS